MNKKEISYWNAIITHLLTTGFMLVILNMVISLVFVAIVTALRDSALLGIVSVVGFPFLMALAVAISTFLSCLFMRRYQISGMDNFINFSSIIFAVAMLLLFKLSLVGIAITAVGTLIFYTISKKKIVKSIPDSPQA